MDATINNAFYEQKQDIWWDRDQPLNLLEVAVNPARLRFFRRRLESSQVDPRGLRALEVGCGGGLLSEEIARLGFATSAVDPSAEALVIARDHASRSGLEIEYRQGVGEALPCADASFDVVFCCDVLEHVQDRAQVLREVARVLKPGGHFFYDTINRTWMSWLVAIKLWQDWRPFAFMPKNLHVWRMFVPPRELHRELARAGLEPRECVGLAPSAHPLRLLYRLRQLKRGRRTLTQMASEIGLRESRNRRLLYAGHAVRATNF